MPGSISFLLVGLAGALVLTRWRGTRPWGRALLVALVAGYWLLASAGFASLMALGLSHWYRPLRSPDEARGATAVVILGGGNELVYGRQRSLDQLSRPSASRVLEGARVYQLLGNSPWVLASGGRTDVDPDAPPEAAGMRDLLVTLGVPADRILLEAESRTTHDEALKVPPILRAHGIQRFVLVTSPTHMLRSMASFRAQGLEPVPAIATGAYGRIRSPLAWLLPTQTGYDVGQLALHEYLGLAYYGVRGWLRF
ncbi:MAG: YdcF family protein [Acidobacteriota bacterium]|nr:YdcF family protein [Acidobacteriota bacterium]